MREGNAAIFRKVGRECLCLHSRMTARTVTRRYNAVLAPLGLEITEFSLLAALESGSFSSISEAAERLAFERTTLVRNLKRMAERGLLRPDSGARRAVRYTLTAEGTRLLEAAVPLWKAAQKELRRNLEGDLASTLDALESLRHATHIED